MASQKSSLSPELQFIQNSNDFGNAFYSAVIKSTKDNVIISPASVHSCAGLLYMGAESKTCDEMIRGLRLPLQDKSEIAKLFQAVLQKFDKIPSLRVANKIYLANGLEVKSEFRGFCKNSFFAEEENLSFEKPRDATNAINNWVKQKTENKITELINEEMINRETLLVLVNAIYFKGKWKAPFRSEATREQPFWISENQSTTMSMMYQKGKVKCIPKCGKLDASVIELDYDGPGDLSMMVILPLARTGLRKLEERLKTFNLLCMSSDMKPIDIVLELPKFVIEFSVDLQLPFRELGMQSMFGDKADFSNICVSKNGPLKVSKAVHKAFIEVNEEGTEAAAATGFGIVPLSLKFPDFEFHADHPFFFVIKTKLSILFMGRYLG